MTEYCQKKFYAHKARVRDLRGETRPEQDRKYLSNQGLDRTGTKQNRDRKKPRNLGLDLTKVKNFWYSRTFSGRTGTGLKKFWKFPTGPGPNKFWHSRTKLFYRSVYTKPEWQFSVDFRFISGSFPVRSSRMNDENKCPIFDAHDVILVLFLTIRGYSSLFVYSWNILWTLQLLLKLKWSRVPKTGILEFILLIFLEHGRRSNLTVAYIFVSLVTKIHMGPGIHEPPDSDSKSVWSGPKFCFVHPIGLVQ